MADVLAECKALSREEEGLPEKEWASGCVGELSALLTMSGLHSPDLPALQFTIT